MFIFYAVCYYELDAWVGITDPTRRQNSGKSHAWLRVSPMTDSFQTSFFLSYLVSLGCRVVTPDRGPCLRMVHLRWSAPNGRPIW
jgi:hypothetical protein